MLELEQNATDTGFSTFDDRSKYSKVTDETEFTMDRMKFINVLDDVILASPQDETEDGIVKRGSLFIPQNDKTRDFYRFFKVVLKGDKVSDMIKIGDTILIAQASLQGMRGIKTNEGKFALLAQSHVLGVVDFKEDI